MTGKVSERVLQKGVNDASLVPKAAQPCTLWLWPWTKSEKNRVSSVLGGLFSCGRKNEMETLVHFSFGGTRANATTWQGPSKSGPSGCTMQVGGPNADLRCHMHPAHEPLSWSRLRPSGYPLTGEGFNALLLLDMQVRQSDVIPHVPTCLRPGNFLRFGLAYVSYSPRMCRCA